MMSKFILLDNPLNFREIKAECTGDLTPNEFISRAVIDRQRGVLVCAALQKGQLLHAESDVWLSRAHWDQRNPAPVVVFMVLPRGGGDSNPIAVIATLALAVFAPWAAGAILGTTAAAAMAAGGLTALTFGLVSSAIYMAGSYLIQSKLVKQPSSPSNLRIPSASTTYSVGQSQNSIRLGELVPVQYGKVSRFYPDIIIPPYFRYSKGVQYMYVQYCLGYGVHDLGNNPLINLGIGDLTLADYNDVQLNVIYGAGHSALVDVSYTASGISGKTLTTDWTDPVPCCPVGAEVIVVWVNIGLPRGLYRYDEGGNGLAIHIEYAVQYRLIDDYDNPLSDWENELRHVHQIEVGHVLIDADRYTLSQQMRLKGRWQCRVRRVNEPKPLPNDERYAQDEAQVIDVVGLWGPATYTQNITVVELVVKASEQLNSSTQFKLWARSTRKIGVYRGGRSGNLEASRGVYDAICDILAADSGAALGVDYLQRIDVLDALNRQSQIEARSVPRYFDYRFETTGISVMEAIAIAARCDRAEPYLSNGKFYFARVENNLAAGIPLNPLSVTDVSVRYEMPVQIQAQGIRISYYDDDLSQADTIDVCLPGTTPTRWQDMTFPGCVQRQLVYEEAVYTLLSGLLERNECEVTTGLEGMIPALCERMPIVVRDLDYGQWGYVLAQISPTRLQLSSAPNFNAKSSGQLIFRKNDTGIPVTVYPTTENNVVELATAMSVAPNAHYVFGVEGSELNTLIVKKVTHAGGEKYKISGVLADDRVLLNPGYAPTKNRTAPNANSAVGQVFGGVGLWKSPLNNHVWRVSWRQFAGVDYYRLDVIKQGSRQTIVSNIRDNFADITIDTDDFSVEVYAVYAGGGIVISSNQVNPNQFGWGGLINVSFDGFTANIVWQAATGDLAAYLIKIRTAPFPSQSPEQVLVNKTLADGYKNTSISVQLPYDYLRYLVVEMTAVSAEGQSVTVEKALSYSELPKPNPFYWDGELTLQKISAAEVRLNWVAAVGNSNYHIRAMKLGKYGSDPIVPIYVTALEGDFANNTTSVIIPIDSLTTQLQVYATASHVVLPSVTKSAAITI